MANDPIQHDLAAAEILEVYRLIYKYQQVCVTMYFEEGGDCWWAHKINELSVLMARLQQVGNKPNFLP